MRAPLKTLISFLGSDIQEYAIDEGRNLTLQCPIEGNKDIAWSREGRVDKDSHRISVLDDGSIFIMEVIKNDSGIYSCMPANVAHDDLKTSIKLSVRSM